MSTPSEYRPGACNIGSDERRRRYAYAAVAYLVAVAYAAVVLLTGIPESLLVGLFVPLSLGTEWLLQARRAFCASLAFSGRYSFGGEKGDVSDPDSASADRRYGFRLTLLGLAGGAVGTALVYGAVVLLG